MNTKTKRKFSILLSFLLTLVMVVGLLPMGQVAYAEEVYPDAYQVFINGKAFNTDLLYYTNGAESAGSFADNPNWNAHYDPTTGILELNNFDDGHIIVGGAVKKDITIKLTGTNKITTSEYGIWNSNGGDITITADSKATLEINVNNSKTVTGISADTGSAHTTGSVTLQGYADVIVKANTTGEYKYAYGIKGYVNASVIGNASFKAICSGTNNGYGYGIYAAEGVTIDTNGTIDIDVTGCTVPNNVVCIGGTHAHTLTKVGKGILKYPSDGGAIAPASSEFSESTHAINKDPINCVESYRYGTPYTVTVESGMADVYGLMNKTSAQFVKGDTVTVTAKTISDLTFKNWTSADVTVADATNETTTFTMPDKDVTVTANYKLFTTEPSFARTSDTKGTISFTLSTTPSSAPKLVEKDSDTVVGSTYFYGSTLDRSQTVTDGTGAYNVPAGEYRIAVCYSDTWMYSDVFTVSYTAAPTTYAVSFDANGGTGTMADVTGVSGEYTLPANGFTAPDGKQFKAWSVGGVEKAAGDKITVTANTTVTAVWEDIPVVTYTVSFDANGGTGTMTDVTNVSGEYTLPANGFTAPDGKQFKSWSVGGNEKAVGDKITVTANTTVTAVWGDIPVVTYTVSFDSNGGTGSMADVTGVSGEYTLPANGFTAPDGKQFKAWSVGGVEKAAGDKITVTANTTVTAVWENIPAATYKVTVTNGTGGGNYAAGATVSITANEASTGEMFDKWEVVSGSITLADANSATTTFVMPAGAVSVKATYKEAPHTHSYGSEWKTDADKHWHECSCGDKSEEAAHTAGDWITDTVATATTDGTKHKECTVCGYVMETATIPATGIEHTHNYSSDWKADADEHWNECECGDKANKAAHADENNDGKCDICDYAMGNADNPGGEIEPDKTGLSGGAIAGIAVGSVAGAAALGCGGFAIFWFVIKKKKFADLIALFKKK